MVTRTYCLHRIGIIWLLALIPVVVQAQEQATLWSFLGIPQTYNHFHLVLTNRLGKHPGLEKKPSLAALADPANLESEVPIIKKAAEIKQAEDLKQQKLKAVKYLTQIGCGCYDTDGSVTEALLAVSDDCTEEVRLTTIESIAAAACGACCENCGQTCCCNKEMLLRLAEMAYERDDSGCYLEPSKRVRQAAARALRICCPDTGPVVMEEPSVGPEPVPAERETVDEPTDGQVDPWPLPPPQVDPTALLEADRQTLAQWVRLSDDNGDFVSQPINYGAQNQGVIVHADADHRLAHVHLGQADVELPVGTRLSVYRDEDGTQYQGDLVVVQTFGGSANVRPSSETPMARIKPGYFVKSSQAHLASESQHVLR